MKNTFEPMLGMLGLSGGEVLLIAASLLCFIVLVGIVAVVAIVLFTRQPPPAKQTAPVPPVPPPVFPKTEILPRKCPQCGAKLPPDAPEGLCPACLLQRGFATETGGPAGQTSFVPPSFSELSQLFPQLEILECLGRGGMGAVYKARQPRLERFVALKILAPEKKQDPQFAERFEREARALARLNHPNIVTVFDFGEVAGQFYLLMEFVDGLTLRQLLQNGKIAPAEALNIVPKICEALQFAHEQGIVHRDIKPENILLDKQGRVKIADFGIAKIAGLEPKDLSLTGARDVMGTPNYMAPEQIEKPQSVDHRADIYSLGVVFYELLTGELPLGKFAPPSQKVRVDVRLDEVVLHALEKEPARRYQHASQVKTAVETIAGSPAEFASAAAAGTPAPFPIAAASAASDKAILPAFLLAFFFGVFGAHRFYVGKFITACVQLLTLCSCILWIVLCAADGPQPFCGLMLAGSIVGCLIWATIDWLLLVCKAFHDSKGRRMTTWTHSRADAPSANPQDLSGKNPGAPAAPHSTAAPNSLPSAMILAPAIALMMAGLLKISAIVLNGWLLVPGSLAMLGGFPSGGLLAAPGFLPLFFVVALFEGIPGVLMLFGGYQMLQRRSYAWAVAAGILGLITCGFISVAVGIWALIVLACDDVKAAFGNGAFVAPSSPATARTGPSFAVVAGSVVLILFGLLCIAMLVFALMPEVRSAAGLNQMKIFGGLPFSQMALTAEQLQAAGIRQERGEFRKETVQSFPLAANGRFSIDNIDGPIEIHGWSSNIVELHAAIHGRTAEAVNALKINVHSEADQVDVHTDFDDHLDSGWNWLRLIGRGSATVAYVVDVPQQAQLSAVHSVDGRIAIDGVAGPITASAVDGAIEIKHAAHDLKLSTVDGSISASLDALGTGQSVSLHTVDGGVTLALPAASDATFSVHTVDGNVTSEFPELQPKKDSVVGHELNGALGQGAAEVKVETVDGTVHLVKSPAVSSVPANAPAPLFYEWRGADWVAVSNHNFSVDSPVVSAAKKWLPLIDAGNYAESWKETAMFVQAKKTAADWNNYLNTNRTHLGKLISRQLVASIPLILSNGVPISPAVSGPITAAPPVAPDGPYVFVLFQSSFTEKKDAKESVTFALEKDGQWRPVSYFIK